MEILRGQRLAMAELGQKAVGDSFQIGMAISGLQGEIDSACFGLDAQQKLSDERYMTFYNQPDSPCTGVRLVKSNEDSVRFLCQLSALPASIDRLVFTAALNGPETMRQMQSGYLRFLVANQEVARFSFSGADFQDEKALMVGEIYRKDNGWRFSATGQGFNGGLAALVKYFGGDVAADDDSQQPVSKISLEKKIAAVAPKLVDLAKKATVSLEKHRLSATVARVGLVLDASGSMYAQYDKGKVQQVIERLLPLAVHFDDDGALDVWAFSSNTLALPPATLQNYSDYIASVEYGWRNWGMMSINNEPAVIEQVIRHFHHSTLPVLIIFVSDGGVSQNAAIKKLLVEAANLPIFWQFVGIGGRNYGILEKLDTLSGRIVDNCGFFSLDDINSVSEQELYERMLSEFPLWLEAAKLKSIVR
jgi:stress response protein SCP2